MSPSRVLPLAVALCIAAPAMAQPVRPFSLAALKTAQAHGQSVLVDVFAPWCPTCRAQAPTIDALATDPAYAKLLILRLDYDHQVAEKKALGVSRQSTIITYRGAKETGRVLGITDPARLRAFAATALR
jgi:thioredoxin 1